MEFLDQFLTTLRSYLPNLLGAFAILIGGWFLAFVIARLVRAGLRRTTIDNRIAGWVADEPSGSLPVEDSVSRVVFWILMLFVLVGFLQAIGLTLLTAPLSQMLTEMLAYAPRVLGAATLLLLAWVLASGLRLIVVKGLERFRLEERLADQATPADARAVPLRKTIGDVVYWLVYLLFLPAILGTLALQGLLVPVQTMVDQVLSYVPNVVTAIVIVALGWFVAKAVQRIVENLLAALGTDQLGARVGAQRALGKQSPSRVLGLVVYVLVLLPVLVAALNALNIDAVTRPASNMLDTMLSAVPVVFASVVILALAFVVARLVGGLVTSLLAGIGFDGWLIELGIAREPSDDRYRASAMVGYVVLVAILAFAAIEASDLLGFATLSGMLADLTVFGGRILLGVVIFALGLIVANAASRAVLGSGIRQAKPLALAARVTVIILSGAVALQEIGIADEVIVLAVGLTLGTVAVAVAVAFGVGGREIAARQLEDWQRAWRQE